MIRSMRNGVVIPPYPIGREIKQLVLQISKIFLNLSVQISISSICLPEQLDNALKLSSIDSGLSKKNELINALENATSNFSNKESVSLFTPKNIAIGDESRYLYIEKHKNNPDTEFYVLSFYFSDPGTGGPYVEQGSEYDRFFFKPMQGGIDTGAIFEFDSVYYLMMLDSQRNRPPRCSFLRSPVFLDGSVPAHVLSGKAVGNMSQDPKNIYTCEILLLKDLAFSNSNQNLELSFLPCQRVKKSDDAKRIFRNFIDRGGMG